MRSRTFAEKNAATSAPENQAASRIVHIDSTGYSSQEPAVSVTQASRYGSRPPVSCSVPRSGSMSE